MQNVLLYILLMAMSAGYALKLPTYDDGGVHYKPRSSLRRGPARSHQRTHQDSVGSVVHHRFREPYHNGHKAYGTKLTSRTGRLLGPSILPKDIIRDILESIERVRAAGMNRRNGLMKISDILRKVVESMNKDLAYKEFLRKIKIAAAIQAAGMNRRNAEMIRTGRPLGPSILPQGILESIERVRAAGMKRRYDPKKVFDKLREIVESLNKVAAGMKRRNAEMNMEMSEAGDARCEEGQTDEMEDYEDDLMYESETDYTDTRNLPKTTSKVLMLCQDSGLESLIREITDDKKTINKDNGRDSQCSEEQTDGDRIIELALRIPANKEKHTDFDSKQNNSQCIPDEFRRTETEVDIVKKVAELIKPVSSTVGGWMISLGLRMMEEVGKKGLSNTIKGIAAVLDGRTTKDEEAIETTGGEGNDNNLRMRGRTAEEVEDAVKSTEKETEKDDESGSTPIPKNKGKQNNTNEQNAVPVENDNITKIPVEVITKEEDKTNNTMDQTDEEGKQEDTDKKKKDPTINDIINHEEARIRNLRRRRSFERLTGSKTASFVEASERRHL